MTSPAPSEIEVTAALPKTQLKEVNRIAGTTDKNREIGQAPGIPQGLFDF